jgi:hypothetical protein
VDALKALGTPRTERCPSDLVLAQYEARSLADPERAQIASHVAACSRCTRWLEEGREAFDALPDADKHRIVTTMLEASKSAKRRPSPAWIGVFAAAAAAVLVISLPKIDPNEDTTPKGKGLSLRVYRERQGSVEKALVGEPFQKDDRLRFEVDLPKPGHVMIVGVEERGDKYRCFPNRGDDSAALPAGERQLLPDTIQLDESVGQETLHLLLCPEPFGFDDLRWSSEKRLEVPPRCQSAVFGIQKSGR